MTANLPDHYRFAETYDENGVILHCRRFVAIAETPQCYRVIAEHMAYLASSMPKDWIKKNTRLVPKQSLRRHCYPSKAEAFQSYLKRKRSHIKRMEFSLEVAKYAKEMAEAIKDKPDAIDAIGAYGDGIRCGRPDSFSSIIWD